MQETTGSGRSPQENDTKPRHPSPNGVTILPIPPALKFPYLRASTDTSRVSTLLTQDLPTSTATPPVTTHGPTTAPPPRPAVSWNKFVTDRPPPRPRASLLGLKRRETGGAPSHGLSLWHFDPESSSPLSGGDNAAPRTKPKLLAGHPAGRIHMGRQRKDTNPSRFDIGNDVFESSGKVSKRDGRLDINLKETGHRGWLAKAVGATVQRRGGHSAGDGLDGSDQPILPLRKGERVDAPTFSRATTTFALSLAPYPGQLPPPKLNIVVMVIGSRGDIQPFLRLGKILKEDHGHRVRIATHPAFKTFVEQDSGLDFFSVGGDPAEIMAFMVKNPGLVPTAKTIREGEIGRRRDSMFEMFKGFWRACINATDDETDVANLKMMGDKNPFIADAIIANPPSMAHIHCAERLGVPLHLMFTFPNSPTQQFPHPLTNIKQTNVDSNYTNFISYPLVETMIWQGLGDLVNRFRVKTLGLEPISALWAPGQLFRLKVPYTYLWSPGLIPKPADWGPEIDVTGFVFLDLASSFTPPEALTRFLEAEDPPVYIGFGSIVVDDPDKLTTLIFEAVKQSGVRALVSKGWGGLGSEESAPENVFMLENTPHDWLFPRVSAAVHHGGAGSTAIGLKCGKPTMIVPFFGDQPFWGAMVANAGAGVEPVPYKKLTAEKLAEGILQLLTPEKKKHAEEIARKIEEEGDGAVNAVNSFLRALPLRGEHSMRCSILEDQVAVWLLKGSEVRLSPLAVEMLVEQKRITWEDLRLLRHYEWNDFEGPGEPITGAGFAMIRSVTGAVHGVGGTPFRWAKTLKRKGKYDRQEKGRKHGVTSPKPTANGGVCGEAKSRGDSVTPKPNDGTLPGGGQHGKEKDLPDGNIPKLDDSVDARSGKIPVPTSAASGVSAGDSETGSVTSVETADGDVAHNLANDAGAGIAQTGEALLKAPMDLSLAVAQGFHNAPRLYGDATVRRPRRVSGFKSGIRAGGEEFFYGLYDGVTGLVRHPYVGASDGGLLGFFKGTARGGGGLVLKSLSALVGPPAYTFKGIHAEIIKRHLPTNFIRHARIIQGTQELRALSPTTKAKYLEAVEKAWRIILELRRETAHAKQHGLHGRVHLWREKRKRREHGAFENVQLAGKALHAEREGCDLGDVFGELKEERLAGPPAGPSAAASGRGSAESARPEGVGKGAAAAADAGVQEKGGRKASTQAADQRTGMEAAGQAAGVADGSVAATADSIAGSAA